MITKFSRHLIFTNWYLEKHSNTLIVGLYLAFLSIIFLMLARFHLPEYLTGPSYVGMGIVLFSCAYFWGNNWFTGLDNLPNEQYFNWGSFVGHISNSYLSVKCVSDYFVIRSTMKHRKLFRRVIIIYMFLCMYLFD